MTNKLYKIEEEATSGWSLYENYRHLTKEQAQEKINLDQIIAIAGDGIIMESQFLEAKETYLRNFKEANVDRPLPPEKFLDEQILENLIIQELQIQRAFKAGVRISDQELNESMSLLAANNKLSLIDFKKEIE